MSCIRGVFAALFISMAVLLANAQDPDPVRARLDAAKKTYETELERQKKDLVDALMKREELVRREGNKKLVDQIVTERLAFETSGELPKVVSTTVYTSRTTIARRAVVAAHTDAIKDYVRKKLDAEAAVVEKELEEFLTTRARVAPADTRTRWVSKAGNVFEIVADKAWQETKPGAKTKRRFTEVARTDDFIDLRADDATDTYIRLHATVFYWGTVDQRTKTRHWAESLEAGTGSWKMP